jgi:hypothetical protein
LLATLPQRLQSLPASPTMKRVVEGEYAFAKQSAAPQGTAVVVMVTTLKGSYEALAAGGSLPPDEFGKLVDQQMAKYPLNPWIKIIGPSMRRARESVAVFEAKQAMFQTAIAIVLTGEEALKNSKDPFGDGAFGHHKRPGGFELISGLTNRGELVKLVVGS